MACADLIGESLGRKAKSEKRKAKSEKRKAKSETLIAQQKYVCRSPGWRCYATDTAG